nr:fiber protein [Lemur mastadenovirus]
MSKKRIVANDFDPVYPYTEQRFNLMPPFYSSNGFEVVDGASLALKTESPLGFSQSGDLTLKIGGGLSTNQNGELIASGTSVPSLAPPLKEQGGSVTLDTGEGLETDNSGKLKVKTRIPLNFDNGSLVLQTAEGLETDNNGKLKVKTHNPLNFVTNGLNLQTAEGLETDSTGHLKVKVVNPLYFDNRSVGLQTADGLETNSNGALQVKYSPPLKLQNDSLTIGTGDGLEINSATGEMKIKASYPLTFDGNANLKLQMNYPFIISNNALALNLNNNGALIVNNNSLSVSVYRPLSLTGNKVLLNWGHSLTISDNKLEVRLASNGAIDNNSNAGLRVRTGNGLAINNNNLEVKLGTGLSFDATTGAINSSVASGGVSVQDPITNTSGSIGLNILDPLQITATGKLGLNFGNGLREDQHQLIVYLGDGLTYSTAVASSGAVRQQDLTQWTTPDPSPNVQVESSVPNGKLTLTLTKSGGLVLGNVSILGVASPLNSIAKDTYTVALRFRSGTLGEDISDLKSNWGWRLNNSYDPNTANQTRNGRYLMPNSLAYPRMTSNTPAPTKSYIHQIVYLGNDLTKPINLTISLNTDLYSSQQHSIIFSWKGLNSYSGQTLDTSPATFSYIAEQAYD